MPLAAIAVQSRRERKKSKTRESIVQAAVHLMIARGYHGTTVADIAERADVAISTVFAHFPTKDDIVFHFYPVLRESFSAALESRAPGQSTLDAFQSWVEKDLAQFINPSNRDLRALRRIIESEERLLALEHCHLAHFSQAFAASIAVELGEAPEDPRPRILAGAALGAMMAVLEDLRSKDWVRRPKIPIGLVRSMLEAGMKWTGKRS
jgi:AcrR family transcriptional regulator